MGANIEAAAAYWQGGKVAACKVHDRYGRFQARCAETHLMPKGYAGIECRTEGGVHLVFAVKISDGKPYVFADGKPVTVSASGKATPSNEAYPNLAAARDAYQAYRTIEYYAHNEYCTQAKAQAAIERHRKRGLQGTGKVAYTSGGTAPAPAPATRKRKA